MVKYHPTIDAELIWRRVAGKNHIGAQSIGVPMIKDPENYPHLFRELEWWEDRDESDLPKYVKGMRSGFVQKVISYQINIPTPTVLCDYSGSMPVLLSNLVPATLEEYEHQERKGRS